MKPEGCVEAPGILKARSPLAGVQILVLLLIDGTSLGKFLRFPSPKQRQQFPLGSVPRGLHGIDVRPVGPAVALPLHNVSLC